MQLHFLSFGGPTDFYRAALRRIRDEAHQMNVFSSITAPRAATGLGILAKT